MRRDAAEVGVHSTAPDSRPTVHPVPGWLTLLGVLLLGLNLRAAIAALSPLLPDVQADLGLSRGMAGLLTTLPVLCFALLSSAAALLGRRVGIEVALLLAMLGVLAGSLLRTLPTAGWMLAGTAVIGAGIAVGNVMMPSIVKQDFPAHQGLVTGLSTSALTGGAAIAAAVSAPLAHSAGLGWRGSLLVIGAFAGLTALVWLPQLRARRTTPPLRTGGASVLRNPVTWQLAVFMAMQSVTYYAVLAWLPALLVDRGISAARAGWALALFNLLGIATAVLVPVLAARRPDQRVLALLTSGAWAVGLVGLLAVPSLYLLWSLVAGLAQGAGIGLALALIVLRAASPESARDLSGAVQAIGYLLGSTGPLIVGVLLDGSGGWNLPLLALCGATAVMALSSYGAARNRPV
ncbi:MFS transporter [Rhizomonospora bruguierae]|uniref:MFS transporter n=1 Tax=Rhizomonospora bruguierae TaxID=1581705 RepID=UPI001BCB49A2|nr:MFS transporter [Micromonospora sp. NBRC 107566]